MSLSALKSTDKIDQAVLLSLFTNATYSGDNGWMGDAFFNKEFGSKIWTKIGTKATQETADFIKFTAKQSLQHLIDNNQADEIIVTTKWLNNERLGLYVSIIKNQITIYDEAFKI